eukprot:3585433-Rhodomonas_salina.1
MPNAEAYARGSAQSVVRSKASAVCSPAPSSASQLRTSSANLLPSSAPALCTTHKHFHLKLRDLSTRSRSPPFQLPEHPHRQTLSVRGCEGRLRRELGEEEKEEEEQWEEKEEEEQREKHAPAPPNTPPA